MTKPIDGDRFGKTIEDLLSSVSKNVEDRLTPAIQKSIRYGAKRWRESIVENINQPEGRTYRKHGKTYKVGSYSKSIRSHMIRSDDSCPTGEIGSPKMAGLVHLLENGHAKIGGGRVKAIPHVGEAADDTFKVAQKNIENAIDGAIDDV